MSPSQEQLPPGSWILALVACRSTCNSSRGIALIMQIAPALPFTLMC